METVRRNRRTLNGEDSPPAGETGSANRQPLKDHGPRFLTVREAADLLRTTPKALYTQLERGRLPGVIRLGRRLLIDAEELLRWLDERRAVSPKETRR